MRRQDPRLRRPRLRRQPDRTPTPLPRPRRSQACRHHLRAARGADRLAATWAKRHGVTLREYPADWKHEGRAAGIRRNARMHDTERPDYVVAFPGGRGTAHMVRYARRRGTPVHHA